MPKLKNHPPKLSKSGNYAYVYLNGERLSMGRYGSKEADQNYRRFIAEWASSSRTATLCPGKRVGVMEVVCAYFDWAKTNIDEIDTIGEVWIYRPGIHKGAWRGHDRARHSSAETGGRTCLCRVATHPAVRRRR